MSFHPFIAVAEAQVEAWRLKFWTLGLGFRVFGKAWDFEGWGFGCAPEKLAGREYRGHRDMSDVSK